ncbi:MAG: DUF975 family protein, partial [Clostridia bacterium]|nr:DUF975 family protein [Clostridia bacterium]
VKIVAKDYTKSAWQSLRGKKGDRVLASLIYDVIQGALGGLAYVGVGAVAMLIVMGPLTIGYSKIALNVARNKEVDLGMLFDGFKDFGRTLVLYITNQIFIFLWTLLLIVPGIIKSFAYSMSYYILLDDPNISANDARKKSIEMMKGNKWRFFCLQFSFIGWGLLCLITFGILTFWVSPYMETAKAKFYLSLLPEEERADSVLNDGGVVVDGDFNSNIDGNDFFDAFDDNSQSQKDDFKDDFDA